jgi:quercetin dioxygenase-like cupin family protein
MGIVHRFNGNTEQDRYEWEGVEAEKYDAAGFEGVVKNVLIGPGEQAPNFIIRYFQLEPGGSSRLERHQHDHGVIILNGNAQVQINDGFENLGPLDVVYVAGDDLHQFVNTGDKTLGFICVIKANI